MGGSFGRLQNSTQWGKQYGDYSTYVAVEGIHDEGWRDHSASNIRRAYGDIGYRGDKSEFHLNITAADNNFGATASAPIQELEQRYSSVYTTPQTTHNQLGMVNLTGSVQATDTLSFAGNLYYRGFKQTHVDGNTTDVQSCDPTVEPGLLASATTQRQLSTSTAISWSTVSTARSSARSIRPIRPRMALAVPCRRRAPKSF